MQGFGGLKSFYYLQLLLAGDNETGREPAQFHTQKPLGKDFRNTQYTNKHTKELMTL